MSGRQLYLRVRNHALRLAFGILHRPQRVDEMTRLGSDYGGYFVPLGRLDAQSICYSGGVGEDTTFDEALIDRTGCTVEAFDPTPRAVAHADALANREPRFHFMPVGLWSEDTCVDFFAPANPAHVSHSITNLQGTTETIRVEVRRLSTVMEQLGHDHIDVLKLDIEGAEHEVIESMLTDSIRPAVLCVEFDQPVKVRALRATLATLAGAGYTLAGADGWNYTFVRGTDG